MSLRFKLILPFALLLTAVFTYGSLYMIPSYVEIAKGKQKEQEATYLDLLSTALLPDLLESDLANIYDLLDTVLTERRHWYSLAVFNHNGVRIYPLADRYIPQGIQLESLKREVTFNQKHYATIKLQLDIDTIIKREVAYISSVQNSVLLILVMTFLIMSAFLDTLIRRPMVKLASFADRIARGNYQSKSIIHSNDEVGQLAQSLETMQHNIHERDCAMSHYSEIQDTIRFIQSKFISEQETSHVFLELQRRILALTQCKLGLIGELMLDEHDRPYLHPLSLNNELHIYSGKIIMAGAEKKEIRFNQLDTLLGKIMTTGRPLIHNGPQISQPELGFSINNLTQATNFLGLPLYTGYQFVGVLCLLNHQQGFDESLPDELDVLLQTLAQLIVAYRERKTLIDNESRLRLVVDNAVEGIISTDERGVINSFNSAAERIFGYSQNQMLGRSVEVLVPADKYASHLEAARFLLNDENYIQQANDEIETDGLHRSGKLIPLELSISKVATQQGLLYTGIVRDITERRQHQAELNQAYADLQHAHEQLEAQSRQDALTGLANRRYLDEVLQLEWKRTGRLTDSPLSLILCDIDYFKKYNDSYGHIEGDTCLQQVSQALQNSFTRQIDLVARYGGEEFMVVLPNTASDSATRQADRMRNNVWELALEHNASEIADRISISVGVFTITSTKEETLSHAIQHADKALYQAKASGRNQVIHYNQLLQLSS